MKPHGRKTTQKQWSARATTALLALVFAVAALAVTSVSGQDAEAEMSLSFETTADGCRVSVTASNVPADNATLRIESDENVTVHQERLDGTPEEGAGFHYEAGPFGYDTGSGDGTEFPSQRFILEGNNASVSAHWSGAACAADEDEVPEPTEPAEPEPTEPAEPEPTEPAEPEPTEPADPEPVETDCELASLSAVANEDQSVSLTAHDLNGSADLMRAEADGAFAQVAMLDAENDTFRDTTTEDGVTYTYQLHIGNETCGEVTVTAIPVFPSIAAGALAMVGGVLGYAVVKRRR